MIETLLSSNEKLIQVQTINWVATEILQENELQRRAQKIAFFIRTIKHMIRLNNFHGAMEILSGIQLPSLSVLKHTWVV